MLKKEKIVHPILIGNIIYKDTRFSCSSFLIIVHISEMCILIEFCFLIINAKNTC